MNDKTKHLQAVCQLAEMEHNADPEHPVKKQKFESAKADFEKALSDDEEAAPATDGQELAVNPIKVDLEILVNLVGELELANQDLAEKNKVLLNDYTLLKEQLNEKSQELERAQKLTVPAVAKPVTTKATTAKSATVTGADEKKN